MKKLMFVAIFIVLFGALIFADTSTSTLEIKGYKLSNMPDGILRVYVYNTTSSQDLTNADLVSNQIDVSDYLSNYISGSKNVFSIKVQTNLNKTITIKVIAAPFTSQDTAKSVISTTYSLSQNAGYYVTTGTHYYYSWRDSGYFYFRYNASATVSSSDITATDATSTNNYSTITLKMESARRSKNRNTLVNSATGGSSYSLTGETLSLIEDGATVDSTIAVKMKLNTTLDEITPNVQYVAPVVIEVSIQ